LRRVVIADSLRESFDGVVNGLNTGAIAYDEKIRLRWSAA
jgi:hypothetical protein